MNVRFDPGPPPPPKPTRREGRCVGCGADIEQCGFDAHPVSTSDGTTVCPVESADSPARHRFDQEPVVG